MKYTVEIDLALPRDRVIELFDDSDNLFKWMRGLESYEHLEGEAGHPGAKSRFVFLMGKRRMEIIETITVRDLPERFEGVYDTKGCHNPCKNRFTELGPEATRWAAEHEFQFSGFMKIIGFLMPGAFKKQSRKYMQDFKAFAEKGVDVREAS